MYVHMYTHTHACTHARAHTHTHTSDTAMGDQNRSLHSTCSNKNGIILISILTQFNTAPNTHTHIVITYHYIILHTNIIYSNIMVAMTCS